AVRYQDMYEAEAKAHFIGWSPRGRQLRMMYFKDARIMLPFDAVPRKRPVAASRARAPAPSPGDLPLHRAATPTAGRYASPPEEEGDMARGSYDEAQLHELLYQGIETELGGEQVYLKAIECAVNDDLRKEWNDYLEETRHHQEVLLGVFEQLGLDPDVRTPGREVVAHHGKSLVKAMEMAQAAGDPVAAELVAAECVVLAETKDHLNWELIGYVSKKATGDVGKVLKAAYE